jgi:hypothetical protein
MAEKAKHSEIVDELGMAGRFQTDPDDQYAPDEAARRRDAVLKIMVNTPPQPRASNRPARKSRKSTGADRVRKDAARQQKS